MGQIAEGGNASQARIFTGVSGALIAMKTHVGATATTWRSLMRTASYRGIIRRRIVMKCHIEEYGLRSLHKVLPSITSCLLLFFLIAVDTAAQEGKPESQGASPEVGADIKDPKTLSRPKHVLKSPKLLFRTQPNYTSKARDAKIEGTVLIEAVVRKDATIDSFNVLKRLGYGLEESAIHTIATAWRFSPATMDGKPVDMLVNFEINFTLGRDQAERESLKKYPLHVSFIDIEWNHHSIEGSPGSGYGNLSIGDSIRGFVFECSCAEFESYGSYPAKWIDPESRIEVALGFDKKTGKQKACELRVIMKNDAYTLKDGQPETIDQRNQNQK
jgi:TonB family protein